MRNLVLAAIAGVALAACSRHAGPPAVEALDAWCRPTPEGALSAACYLTLTANSDDRFAGVTTPAAGKAEIHTMSMDGDIMRMRPMPEGVKLPRNTSVALTPGAEHLMLIGPTARLVEGQTVTLNLTFDKAPPLVVTAAVRQAPVAGGHAGGH